MDRLRVARLKVFRDRVHACLTLQMEQKPKVYGLYLGLWWARACTDDNPVSAGALRVLLAGGLTIVFFSMVTLVTWCWRKTLDVEITHEESH